jgi:hypothetical protein
MKDKKHPTAGEQSPPGHPFVLGQQPASGFLILVVILIVLQLGSAALVAFQLWRIGDLEQRIERLQEELQQGKPPQPPDGEP